MSSTYSSNLRIELIGSGDQAGTWGATTNSNFAYVLETAITGYQAVTVTSTNQALTYINGATATPALNQSVYAMLKFNSAAAASNIYAPPVSKQYILWNNTSYAITIYNSTVIGNTTAAGTGVTLAAGVPSVVQFAQISVFDATKWVFSGIPNCKDNAGNYINFTVSAKTGTGFTVTADHDSSFEYTAVKL